MQKTVLLREYQSTVSFSNESSLLDKTKREATLLFALLFCKQQHSLLGSIMSSSSTTTTNKRRSTRRTSRNNNKVVTFDKVEIREYSRCLGDNPSCYDNDGEGPPLSLDWSYVTSSQYSLKKKNDPYSSCTSTSSMPLLPLTGTTRQLILLKHSVATYEDIINRNIEMQTIHDQRQISIRANQKQYIERWHLFKESIQRKLKRLFFKKGILSKERDEIQLLWKEAAAVAEIKKTITKSILINNSEEEEGKTERTTTTLDDDL